MDEEEEAGEENEAEQTEETTVADCESTIAQEEDGGEKGCEIADEIETTIKHAAGRQRVVRIRLEIGGHLSVSKVVLAGILHRRFPDASIDMRSGKKADTVVVRDIEVE